MKISLKEYCTFHSLPTVSFEGLSLKIKINVILQIVCLYRPPSSQQTKCNVQTFKTEFSDLLEQYITAHGNLLITGDFNCHYDQPNSTDIWLIVVEVEISRTHPPKGPHLGLAGGP